MRKYHGVVFLNKHPSVTLVCTETGIYRIGLELGYDEVFGDHYKAEAPYCRIPYHHANLFYSTGHIASPSYHVLNENGIGSGYILLFRDLIARGCCSRSARKQRAEKIRKAEARVIATRALAQKPNAFLLGQVMAISSLSSELVRVGSVKLALEECDEEQLEEPGPSTA